MNRYKEINDLENKIKELKEEQNWEIFYNKYLSTKEFYEGKCFSSYALTRPLPKYRKHDNVTFFSAIKIDKVYMGTYNVVIENFDQWKKENINATYMIIGERLDVRIESNDQFSISLNKIKETIRDYSFSLESEPYEISIDLFNSIKELLVQNQNNFFNTILKNIEISPYIEKNNIESLERWGTKMIELSSDEIYILKDKPFRYEDRLIVNEASINMLNELLNDAIKKDKNQKGFYCYGEYYPPSDCYKKDIETLTNILDKIKEL